MNYTKYIGNSNIVNFLQKIEALEIKPHAFLFSGPSHIGKTTLANIFFKNLHCQSLINKSACEKCSSCRLFISGTHPDHYVVEREQDKKNISIDQIRELRSKLSPSSFSGGCKTVLVTQVNDLNQEAVNAFLKLLEEPPKQTFFILTSDNPQLIPKTLHSRCVQIFFSLVSDEEMKNNFDIQSNDLLYFVARGKPGLMQVFSNENEQKELYIQAYKKTEELFRLGFSDAVPVIEKLLQDESYDTRDILMLWSVYFMRNGLHESYSLKTLLLESSKNLQKNVQEKLIFENLFLEAKKLFLQIKKA